jgi:prolyl-tRNA editing enzyme YbaK/EbsC (Cys-tRNA(Pro) deacylase)
MRRLSPVDLKAFMRQHGLQGEILSLDVPTPTVETAARAVGTQPEQIVKSILFLVEGQPVLAVTCGDHYVDRRAIASLYGVGRKRVRLASPEEVLRLAGYAVGSMPPFGHLQLIPTLIDPHVLENSTVYAGGGAENALVRLIPRQILEVTGARIVDLLEKADENRAAEQTGPAEL